MRVAGDPNMKVTRIAMGPGYAYPRMTPDVDVVIGGETAESDGAFDITSYVRDAAALGIPKGQITLGHMVSEQISDCSVEKMGSAVMQHGGSSAFFVDRGSYFLPRFKNSGHGTNFVNMQTFVLSCI